LLASKEGALRSLDSSIFNTRGWPAVPMLEPRLLELVPARLLELVKPWLNICQGTGTNLPVILDPIALLGIPEELDRLEGTVSRPEVDVSDTPPELESDRIANCTRPLCGSTTKSRICPRVLPSWDWTVPLMRLLKRTLLPELIELWLEPKLLDEPKLLELELCRCRVVSVWDDADELGLVLDDDCWASKALLEIERIPPQIKPVI